MNSPLGYSPKRRGPDFPVALASNWTFIGSSLFLPLSPDCKLSWIVTLSTGPTCSAGIMFLLTYEALVDFLSHSLAFPDFKLSASQSVSDLFTLFQIFSKYNFKGNTTSNANNASYASDASRACRAIPHICPFWYTTVFFVKVHQRVRKFATKEPILAKILRSLF